MDESAEPIDILLVDADPARARLVGDALDGSGYRIVAALAPDDDPPWRPCRRISDGCHADA